MCIRDSACVVRQTGGQLFQVADGPGIGPAIDEALTVAGICLLYTSDAADERSSVDLGGRRIIKKKQHEQVCSTHSRY